MPWSVCSAAILSSTLCVCIHCSVSRGGERRAHCSATGPPGLPRPRARPMSLSASGSRAICLCWGQSLTSRLVSQGRCSAWPARRTASAAASSPESSTRCPRAHREIVVRWLGIPALFALIPFGGAGPLHGCRLAELLDIPAVIIPPRPGVLSTWGLLDTDIRATFVRTVGVTARRAAAADPSALEAAWADLTSAGAGLARRRADPARSPALRAERRPSLRASELRADVSARREPAHPRAPRRADRDVSRGAPAAVYLRLAARPGRAGQSPRHRSRHPAEAGGGDEGRDRLPLRHRGREGRDRRRPTRVLPKQRRRHRADLSPRPPRARHGVRRLCADRSGGRDGPGGARLPRARRPRVQHHTGATL